MDLKQLMKKVWESSVNATGYDPDSQYIESFESWYAEKGETLSNEYKASLLKPLTEKINEGLELIKEEMENFVK